MAEQERSFGERAVGLSFNPSGDPEVLKLKQLAAAFIDACQEMRVGPTPDTKPDSEVARMASVAITEAQTAQMWAVKAATWRG